MNAAGNGGHLRGQRVALEHRAIGLQLFDRELQRHPCAGNGGGAGAAIGLDHVAVDRDLPLTKSFKIEDRKGVLYGKSVSVRIDLGDSRVINKKTTQKQTLG